MKQDFPCNIFVLCLPFCSRTEFTNSIVKWKQNQTTATTTTHKDLYAKNCKNILIHCSKCHGKRNIIMNGCVCVRGERARSRSRRDKSELMRFSRCLLTSIYVCVFFFLIQLSAVCIYVFSVYTLTHCRSRHSSKRKCFQPFKLPLAHIHMQMRFFPCYWWNEEEKSSGKTAQARHAIPLGYWTKQKHILVVDDEQEKTP